MLTLVVAAAAALAVLGGGGDPKLPPEASPSSALPPPASPLSGSLASDGGYGGAAALVEQRPASTETSAPAGSTLAATLDAKKDAPISRGQIIVKATWGSGPGDLGRRMPAEGEPEAPSSFAVEPNERVHILDQVNRRIQIFEPHKPSPVSAVPLPSDTYQDIAIDSHGNTFVLDKLSTKSVAMIDETGRVARSIPLVGEGVTEPGSITGLFVHGDGVWVEVGHATLVHIADATGAPDPARRIVQGRFSPDGLSLLLAGLAGPTGVLVSSKPATGGRGAFSSQLTFPMRVAGLHALEGDAAGRIYVAVHQVRDAEGSSLLDGGTSLTGGSAAKGSLDAIEERETVAIVGPDGAEVGRVEIAPILGPAEPFRPIRISADGILYEFVCRDDGATLEKYAR